MSTGLFRPQVLTAQHGVRFGQRIFYQPLTVRLMVLMLLVLFACLLTFAANAEIKQTKRVRGHLVPAGGEVKVYAGSPGVLTEIFVSNGEFVQAGTVLATVSDPQYNQQGQAFADLALQQIDTQLQQLLRRQRVVKTRFNAQASLIRRQLSGMQAALVLLREEQDILQRRVALSEQDHEASNKLYRRSTISQREFRQSASALYLLQQQEKSKALAIARHLQAISETEQQLGMQPLLAQEERLVLDNAQSQLLARKQEIEVRRRSTIIASRDGTVSNLLLREGDVVDPGEPVLTLSQIGEELEAWLYLPSSALAKVGKGVDVMISYDAYPAQTYGSFPAQILNVADSVMDPREYLFLVDVREPVYLVRARVADQRPIGQEGSRFRPGMQFFADIVTGEQTVLQKLLAPLSGLGRRM
ncbi:HlyD family secretion protein [Pseudohongiella sp.]|uniref:Membrane fusion protein biotin-lipoyl like domain-containing protein n=1 Tax=marine sediment metagenome TaxID=412755 RepID=A0A0F9W0C5_9ZZZZ|nr:HlyD family efflux transporter periplasmic adaptor subunit [Pseudohongiella sp.]HDZ09965.1 HlyD family efflux transporter periplasmic adaptor subunit [Pseudohongiella sp.]HEA63743.1 HlyD family efflux transporter periplasmic adaptor subunit [Pseudohongiella sp.]